MAATSRIPRDIKSFVPYMQDTDDYQLAIDPVTTTARYINWGWLLAESTKWTEFRDLADSLFLKYNNKAKRTTDDTNNLHLLIKNVVKYDTDNHLLDRISTTALPPAVLADFVTFHVKRGTPLADSVPTHVEDGMEEPVIIVKKTDHLVHILGITNPDLETKGRGKNIKEVQVWRAIVAGGAAEPVDNAYTYIGEAKRGLYKSEFTTDDVRKDAWYKSRYKNTQGKFGDFCTSMSATVV